MRHIKTRHVEYHTIEFSRTNLNLIREVMQAYKDKLHKPVMVPEFDNLLSFLEVVLDRDLDDVDTGDKS